MTSKEVYVEPGTGRAVKLERLKQLEQGMGRATEKKKPQKYRMYLKQKSLFEFPVLPEKV